MSGPVASVELNRMASGADWLWRPVAAGMTDAVELHRTTLTMCDFADMNEKLDVDLENEYLVRKAQADGR